METVFSTVVAATTERNAQRWIYPNAVVAHASLIFMYIWRRQGPFLTRKTVGWNHAAGYRASSSSFSTLLAHPIAHPRALPSPPPPPRFLITQHDMLRLSQSTSWDQHVRQRGNPHSSFPSSLRTS